MVINNPIPRSLKSECRKAARILSSFVKPNQALGPSEVIPPEVLRNAKGLAIITVFKAGFLFSARAGSGIIVARLPDGNWSAPSAIVTAGAGVGGQVGAELTDFVFILNSKAAVDSFAQYGSITLGGNISVAAGPLGRNAEAAGTASLKSASSVFSYSKTKGLFAGVSLEGSAIVERREANRKFYGPVCKASQILSGRIDPPPACDALLRILESRAFSRRDFDYGDSDYYDDIPSTFSSDSSSYNSPRSATFSRNRRQRRQSEDDDYYDEYEDDDYGSRLHGRNRANSARSGRIPAVSRGSTRNTSWEDDVYDNHDRRSRDVDDLNSRFHSTHIDSNKPSRPRTEKPVFADVTGSGKGAPTKSSVPRAIALFSFNGEQVGDLPFRKGDVIEIVEKSNSTDDWWKGKNNGKEGIFPANYVNLI